MEKPGLRERFVTPVLVLFCVMTLSWLAYNLSWRLESVSLHRFLASLSGTLLFVSVAFGAIPVYAFACSRGAPLTERVIASVINPFLWATKECIRLCISFTFLESVYYYLNPLNILLAFGVIAEMAFAEILCRKWLRKRGEAVRVFPPFAVAGLLISLSLVVALYAWGEGENVYVLFLEGYRFLFGAGAGVRVGF